MLVYWRPQTIIAPPLETQLVIEPPDGAPFVMPVEDSMIVGRHAGNEIAIRDAHLARRHARFQRTSGGLIVEDLGSDNGTYVSGRLQRRHLLHVGDVVTLGRSRISFEHTLAMPEVLPEEARRLFAAVCADPDDDEPRLVLADWLAARGDPRGEFITCQIAAESSVNTEARDHADALLARHELAWVAPLPIPIASWTFRRGFLDCVWLRPDHDPAPLRRHHPLRAILHPF